MTFMDGALSTWPQRSLRLAAQPLERGRVAHRRVLSQRLRASESSALCMLMWATDEHETTPRSRGWAACQRSRLKSHEAIDPSAKALRLATPPFTYSVDTRSTVSYHRARPSRAINEEQKKKKKKKSAKAPSSQRWHEAPRASTVAPQLEART
ncbi:hypothetical protein BV20DRAFT_589941 [Pilatotrama ljubarskyi]|nr:hypothetical protein BV20DRAFT_589941 [Pilatotrama ljubarskyi]